MLTTPWLRNWGGGGIKKKKKMKKKKKNSIKRKATKKTWQKVRLIKRDDIEANFVEGASPARRRPIDANAALALAAMVLEAQCQSTGSIWGGGGSKTISMKNIGVKVLSEEVRN